MANVEIRIKLATTGVKQYQVAAEIGVAEATLSRKLRYELPDSEKQRILEAIERLTAEMQPAQAQA